MNQIGIKRFSVKFIAYLIFILCFAWMIPIILYCIISYILNFPVSIHIVFSVICTISIPALTIYFMDKFPYKYSMKLIRKFKENFPNTYSFSYQNNHLIVDEVNGQIAVVTNRNPFQIQVMDASYIDSVAVFPIVHPSQNANLEEIGVTIILCKKKYQALTYSGRGFRYTFSVPQQSEVAQKALQSANELATHIMNAKVAAGRIK